MQVEPVVSKKRKSAPRTYSKSAIAYTVNPNAPEPKRWWRISNKLPADQYWKKRYWRRRITGRGDYTMDPTHSFGYRYGGYVGSKIGEVLGGTAHNLISSVTGLGDYAVKKNVFLSGRLPQIVNNPSGGGTVIRFQEYLGDIFSAAVAGNFASQSYLINAGNPNTFPFLSQVAQNYEQYSFEGIIFEFKSTSANALDSVNTALGSVMLATQYDTFDSVFNSKLDMLNYEFSSSCKPAENCVHMIECAPRQTSVSELYTLAAEATPVGADPRLYHLGRFTIATTGFQGTNVNCGQLHLTYQVRLLKPKLFATLGAANLYHSDTLGDGTGPVFLNAEQFGTPAALSTRTVLYDNIPINITTNRIEFPRITSRQYYRVSVHWAGSVSVALTRGTFSLSGMTQTDEDFYGDLGGLPTQECTWILGVYTNGGSTVPFIEASLLGVGWSLPQGNQAMEIRVIQVPPESNAL